MAWQRQRLRRFSTQQSIRSIQGDPKNQTPVRAYALGSEAPSVYTTLPGKLRRLAIDLILLRAEVANRQGSWVMMELHSTRAAEVARSLNDKPISAWCEFHRGIAFFGQGKWTLAQQSFENARPCIGSHISDSTAELWRKKLRAVYQSPFRPTYTPRTQRTPMTGYALRTPYGSRRLYGPRTPYGTETPYTMKSTPIDQSLFQGFESLNRDPPRAETLDSVPPKSAVVPVIRQPLPPAALRSWRNARRRTKPVPQAPGTIIDPTGFGPSSSHEFQTLQGSANQATRKKNSPTVRWAAGTPSTGNISPRDTRRWPRFAATPTIVEVEEETDRESPPPPPLKQSTRRFSLDSDSPRSNHSSKRDYPKRSNSLSVNFKPASKSSEPGLGSSPSEPAAKLFTPTLSSPTKSSFKKPTPPSQTGEGHIQHAGPNVIQSGSSPRPPVLPFDDGPMRAAVTYPYQKRRNQSGDTSYAGSTLMSPQVMPPDLDDDRQEFSVHNIINPSLQLNSPSSQKVSLHPPERSIIPVTEQDRRRAAIASGLVFPDDGPGLKSQALSQLALELVSTESALSGSGGTIREEEAPSSSKPSRPDEQLFSHRHDTDQPQKERRVIDKGKGLRSQLPPPSDQLGNLIPLPGETREAKNEAPVSAPHVQENTVSNVRHDGSIALNAQITDTKDVKGNKKASMKEAKHINGVTKNRRSDSDKRTQPQNPFKYGIRKSRKDSDFDSLYDVSTSGSGSGSGVNASDDKVVAGDERTNAEKKTSHEHNEILGETY